MYGLGALIVLYGAGLLAYALTAGPTTNAPLSSKLQRAGMIFTVVSVLGLLLAAWSLLPFVSLLYGVGLWVGGKFAPADVHAPSPVRHLATADA
jgi:hypothetical protein